MPRDGTNIITERKKRLKITISLEISKHGFRGITAFFPGGILISTAIRPLCLFTYTRTDPRCQLTKTY